MLELARKGDFLDNWSPLSIYKKFDDIFKYNSNIYFSEDEYYDIVECDLPGVDKEHIKVTLDEERGHVVVEADNKSEYNRRKYRYTFSINPEDIDMTTDPYLSLDKGVLTIKFKKSEYTKTRNKKEKILRVE